MDLIWIALNLQAIAAGTAEERHCAPPGAGEWILESATFTPSTTSALDATNTATISLKFGPGGTVIATLTNAAAAFTKGVSRAFDLTGGGKNLEFTGGAGGDTLEAAVSHAASGSVVDGTLNLGWRKARRDA